MDSASEQNIVLLTIEEFSAIYGNREERYELIDGIPYMMAAPAIIHQGLSAFLLAELYNFLKGKKCRVFAAPCDVFLTESPRDEAGKVKVNKRVKGTVVQPDLVVICDEKKIKRDGCHGAPDLIVEILSESTKDKDTGVKLYKYHSSGVREYWVVDPDEETIEVYHFTPGTRRYKAEIHGFADKVKSHVLDGLEIDFTEFDLNYLN